METHVLHKLLDAHQNKEINSVAGLTSGPTSLHSIWNVVLKCFSQSLQRKWFEITSHNCPTQLPS